MTAPLAPGARALIFLVAGAMFMENLDGTIIATALPAMARSFGHAPIDLDIGISAYLLALGVFIPASGWVADRFGARATFMTAITLFTLASAACGMAQGLGMFVSVRIVQGMAGAMMVPVGRLVVLRETPKERLMEAMATLVWPALIAPVLGPPLGGLITTHATWRWIFYLNLPLGLVALGAAWKLVPDVREDDHHPFDWPGFLLCGAGTFSLLWGLERVTAHFSLPALAITLAGGALVLLALRHFRRAETPMIDLTPWRTGTFRMAMRGGSLMRMAVGSAPFLLPLMFQVGLGLSPQTSGFLMLGVFGANFGMKAFTNQILRRFGFRRVLVWNGLLCAASLAACALIGARTPLALTVLILLIGGAARSMQFTTVSMITFADVPKSAMSGANGLASTIGQITMGLGITLGAMGVRAGAALFGGAAGASAATPYHVAFLIVAAVVVMSLIDALRLPDNAGRAFTGQK